MRWNEIFPDVIQKIARKKQRVEGANEGVRGIESSIEEKCDLQDDLYLKEIKSLSDDELTRELRSAFYGALAAYKEGKLDIYEKKSKQYIACGITYLVRMGVDRDDALVKGVAGSLRISSQFKTGAVVGSKSLEVCADARVEAANDDVETIEKVADAAMQVVPGTEVGACEVSSVLNPLLGSSKVIDAASVRSV